MAGYVFFCCRFCFVCKFAIEHFGPAKDLFVPSRFAIAGQFGRLCICDCKLVFDTGR